MRKPIKVLIQGTGFAGQGHAEAFRYAGAEVVGIVGRTESVVKEVAAQLAIPYAGTHWEEALQTLKPDIVSIATPGGAHEIPIIQAIQHGCHVFSDKPLSTTGESAQRLYELAEQKQVKTAFAASFRYMPDVIHAKRLIEAGEIGEPQEVECISHFNLEKHIPYGWSHRKEDGGGRLNNNFTHKLSIVTSMIGEHLLSMMGEVRDDLGKAPIVEGVHNFKKRRDFIPQDINDPDLTWGESNVEWSYTVLAQIQSELAKKPVSVLFKHGGLHPRFNDDHIVVYGSKGAIYIKGHYASGPLYLYRNGNWEAQPLPQDIIERIPEGESDTERNWRYLIRLLIEDVQGNGVQPYQTFKEGAQYQKLIDLIRQNDNWVDVSQL
ncbi:oxidoreductase [Alteromonas australica]|jgi:predicted dehydrogenase|uniref:Gfo/Idh/MocA family protein n=1 Tax=Alteromonas sp. B31-7 TaxID=2785913 RepID=UPI0005C42D97|nr:Gfo/Idh/MocA family oxidoreductase [Alteromonas sp. B31-7]AJP44351.1 oxidoreductase [Alteromonas australica]QPL51424.1 Gfo/Idh/MocA family oxidoreductase [Alteromonas sp. B31-7]